MFLFRIIISLAIIVGFSIGVGVYDIAVSQTEGAAPTLSRIAFASEFDATGEAIRGILVFNDPDRDLVKAKFTVIESVDFKSFELDLTTYNGPPEGSVEFFISTTTPKRVTMDVILVDAQDLRSEPQEFSFRAITLEPRTLHVPSEYESPALAVRFARDGDTIEIAEGTYTRVELDLEKSITLQGEEGTRPVLDGGRDSIISILENAKVVIRNLALTNGRRGIQIFDEAQLLLEDIEITKSNTGVFVSGDSKVTIRNSTISDNVHESDGELGR